MYMYMRDFLPEVFLYLRSNKELRDCDGDKEMFEAFKKVILPLHICNELGEFVKIPRKKKKNK